MQTYVQPDRGIQSIGDLFEAAKATLRLYWREAQPYQRFAYGVGALLIASAAFHALVWIATGGGVEGAVSWRKPVLFGEAFGLTAISVGWVMSFLPKRRVVGWILMGALGLANLYEVFWVSLQQWRGVPSHFNYSTPLDEALFGSAGTAIAVTASVILIVTLWAFTSLRAPASLAWAIRVGMVLLVATQVIGFMIIQNGNTRVTDPQTGAFLPEELDSAAVFGEAGSMKLPHALTLHGVQALPLLAILLQFTRLGERRRTGVVLAASLGMLGLVAVTLMQTFRGRAPLDLDPGGLLLFLLSALLILGAYVGAVRAVFGPSDRASGRPAAGA